MALLLAHENITNGFYPGNDKQLLVANVLFKLGGSAAVMSTRPAGPAAGKVRADVHRAHHPHQRGRPGLHPVRAAQTPCPITWGYYYLTRTACLYSNQALKAAWESRT